MPKFYQDPNGREWDTSIYTIPLMLDWTRGDRLTLSSAATMWNCINCNYVMTFLDIDIKTGWNNCPNCNCMHYPDFGEDGGS